MDQRISFRAISDKRKGLNFENLANIIAKTLDRAGQQNSSVFKGKTNNTIITNLNLFFIDLPKCTKMRKM